MIVKVKEPIEPEYPRMREGQLLFTYLHLAPDRILTRELLKRKVTGIAYETITDRRGGLPLLTPMSEVAGRMAIQVGAQYLEKMNGGRGVLLGGVPGVPAARIVIIGGGVVGTNAAKIAVGMGAQVTIVDKSLDRLRELDDIFLSKISTLASSSSTFALTNATLPYVLKLANRGFLAAVQSDPGLKEGVNTYAGKLTYEAVAIDQQREYTSLDEMLGGATTTSATHGT